jgi:1-pyrroline-4-hydroxy-2-carboxylate deaminase
VAGRQRRNARFDWLAGAWSSIIDTKGLIMTTPQQLRPRIQGVIAGIVTLYGDDYSINHAAMRAHAEFLIDHGIDVLMISRGVSELPYLTLDEIVAITQTVVEAAAGRVPVITSTFEWATGQAIDFVQRVEDVGADGCMVVLPPLYCGYDPALHGDAACRHFEAIAGQTGMGLLIHERGWGAPPVPFLAGVLDRLADIDHVVGLKLEAGDRFYAHEVARRSRDRLAIIGDWGPEAWFFSHELGAPANIGGMSQYAPQLEVALWRHMQAGRLAEARRLINEVMTPYWVAWKGMDWVAAMKASMEFVGLPASPMRPPNPGLTGAQRGFLRAEMERLGLLKL